MEPVYIALDLETTGLNPDTDSIIEIGAVKFRGLEVLETYQRFVRPRSPIPIKITRLTTISDADVADAPTFNALGADLARFIKSYPLVGHSINTDIRFLARNGLHINQPSFDTFDLGTLLVPQLSNYSLSTLAAHLQIKHPDAHRALADADVSRQVFIALLDRLAELPVSEIHMLAKMTEKLNWSVATLFGELAKRRLQTVWQAAPDHTPPAYERPVPLEPTGSEATLDEAAIGDFFGPGGALGQLFPGYESRPQQAEMAQAVARAFNQHDTLLVEAGTGTGKSIGYLVPAALYALQHGERVVISTNTINLQDQLASKDIPILQHILEAADPDLPALRAVQLKGRSNYLCLKRYQMLRDQPEHSEEQTRALVKIQLWLPATNTGDRSELVLMRNEAAAWNNVNVNPDMCLRQRCPLYKECFYFKARHEAEAAHLIVANHALLMSDVRSPGILPAYQHLIVDEAHNLEDVATDQLGFSVAQAELDSFFDDLEKTGGPRLVQGILAEWPNHFKLSTVVPNDRQRIERLSEEIRPSLARAREHTQGLWSTLLDVMEHDRSVTQYDSRLRLTPRVRRRDSWQTVEQHWENLGLALRTIADRLQHFQQLLEDWENRDIQDYDGLLARVRGLAAFAEKTQQALDTIVFGNEETVTWLTLNQRNNSITAQGAPLDVSGLLVEQLWGSKRTNVLVSATFSINQSFAYPKARLGLDNASELQLDSPFDYAQSTLLFLPTDMPEPNERGYQRAVEDALIELCRASQGRTLALFTANQALRQTYAGIQEVLESAEIATLAQGIDGSRRSLIERLKSDSRTVLLGTSSFWEGVDVVGEALSVLVIAKLPFSVPNDPVFSARAEQFDDAFLEYSVPQAILRFKQGFGRLIRSKEDRGIVVVLDRRLLSKRYGQMFINSLPSCSIARKPLKELPATAAQWLK